MEQSYVLIKHKKQTVRCKVIGEIYPFGVAIVSKKRTLFQRNSDGVITGISGVMSRLLSPSDVLTCRMLVQSHCSGKSRDKAIKQIDNRLCEIRNAMNNPDVKD